MNHFPCVPELIYSVEFTIQKPIMIGPVPEGFRTIIPVDGGTITGARLNGTVPPGGTDYYTARTDGIGVIDLRHTIKSDDGALIYVTAWGFAELGADGYTQLLEGHTRPTATIRSATRYQTSHPDYLWLNRIQCVGIGESDRINGKVMVDYYAMT